MGQDEDVKTQQPHSSAHREMAESSEPAPKKNRCEGFSRFIYDRETGQVLGRTPINWLYLLIFYIIFWGFLVAFFAAFYVLFFNSLSMKYPRLYGDSSYLKDSSRTTATPGMGFNPQPDSSQSLIRFTAGDNSTYTDYVGDLETFLGNYQDVGTYSFASSLSAVGKICNGDQKADINDGCFFDVQQLGSCGRGSQYGFDDGKPCVMLRLNKIIGWTPKPIICTSDSTCSGLAKADIDFFKRIGRPGVPLTTLFDGNSIPFTCEGITAADHENLVSIKWFPDSGSIPLTYYPYMNQDNYKSPVVMAKITVTPGVLVLVRCRAWAQNIRNTNFLSREGAVHFELLVQQ